MDIGGISCRIDSILQVYLFPFYFDTCFVDPLRPIVLLEPNEEFACLIEGHPDDLTNDWS